MMTVIHEPEMIIDNDHCYSKITRDDKVNETSINFRTTEKIKTL